jgi:hypothetical protein
MSNGHDGLKETAKKVGKLDVSSLRVGQFALFINKAFTACKFYAANNVVLHYKHPLNHCLDYKALKLLPDFFDGQNLNYTRALKQAIKDGYPHLFDGDDDPTPPKRKKQGKDF